MDTRSEFMKTILRQRIKEYQGKAKQAHQDYFDRKDWSWAHKVFYFFFGRPPGLVSEGRMYDQVWIELDDLDLVNMELWCLIQKGNKE